MRRRLDIRASASLRAAFWRRGNPLLAPWAATALGLAATRKVFSPLRRGVGGTAVYGRRLALVLAAMGWANGGAAQEPPTPPDTGKTVVLQALDKITARLTTLEAATGPAIRFGTLEITAMACDKRPPEEPPETTAFLIVDDHGVGHAETEAQNPAVERVFSGWMFASSPGVSALEHPVYDLWVIDCKTVAPSASPGSL